MITTEQVIEALNRLLVAKWPQRTVYVNVCPIDFARPSSWLRVTRDGRKDANRWMVRRELDVELILFDELDDHYEAHRDRLDREAGELLELLDRPLAVGSRRLSMMRQALPRDPDKACIKINLVWLDSRSDSTGAGQTAPVAHTLGLRGTIKP